MQDTVRQLHSTLKEAGYSLTEPRKAVFLTLLGRDPLTMNEIAELVSKSVNRSSVYRVMAVFEKLGIVERLQLGWKYKLELSDAFSAHHHHLSCLNCGKVQSFEESPSIGFELKQLADEAGFTESGHLLEIRGLCRACQT